MDEFPYIIGGALLLLAAAFGVKENPFKSLGFGKTDNKDDNGQFGVTFGNGQNSSPQVFERVEDTFIFGGSGDDILGGQGNDLITSYAPSIKQQQISDQIIKDKAFSKASKLLERREGFRDVVYRDSRGFPTVGIGHFVLPADNLSVGDQISTARINAFFRSDINKAFNAAYSQARELGKHKDADMIAVLTSVNFQLGTGWTREFNNTWAKLKRGDWEGAVSNISRSLWSQQTPTRTADFIETIRKVYA